MSSILEKLLILIQLDATDVQKGADDVEKSTSKIEHSFDETGRHSELLEHLVHHLRRELTGFVFSLLGVGAALEGIHKTFDYFNKLSGASDLLQVNVEELDAWNEAIVKAGGTAEGFDESIKKVAEHFHTTNAIALKVLPQLAGLFQHLNKIQSLEYGKKIGLDEPTIQLLQRGRKEVEAVIATQKKLGVITEEQKDKLDKFNAAWGDTKQQLRLITFETELQLFPALTKIVKVLGSIFESLETHSDFAKGAIIAIGVAIAYMGRAALVAWIEFLGPIALAIAGIAAIGAAVGLLYEDIRAFMKGQESFIGNLIKEYPKLGKVILAVIDGIKQALQGLLWLWKKEFELLMKSVDKIEAAYSKVKGFLGSHFGHHGENIKIAQKIMHEASSNPLTSQTAMSIGYGHGALRQPITKNNNISIGEINVNTQAADAAGISNAIGKNLYDHLFQLSSNFDDGQVI